MPCPTEVTLLVSTDTNLSSLESFYLKKGKEKGKKEKKEE